jgi:hypothetical protein
MPYVTDPKINVRLAVLIAYDVVLSFNDVYVANSVNKNE